MAINPDVDEIYAITDGTLVYVAFKADLNNPINSIEPPQSYLYHPSSNLYSFGCGINETLEPVTIVISEDTTIEELQAGPLVAGSIFYPL